MVDRVKFGLFAINNGTYAEPEAAMRVTQHAETAGFETGEHVVLPNPQPAGFSMPPTPRGYQCPGTVHRLAGG
jgi:hypothetical protein